MPAYNRDVARILDELADLLEIEGANTFRVRAYREASRTISTMSREVATMVHEGEDLTEIQGIGEGIAGKIKEIVETGKLHQLEEVGKRTPPGLGEMLDIPGLGPKRVQALHEHLGVNTLEDLEEAVRQGRIQDIPGFGAKTADKIRRELQQARQVEQRIRLDVAEELVAPLMDHLRGLEGVDRVTIAGSYRRRRETVGDLDILATGKNGKEIIDQFVAFHDVSEIVSQGETRSTVLLRDDLQVDLRVVADESYGAAMLYFTGSKPHNIELRNMALDKGLKVNEYGVFRGDERIAGRTEDEIYALFDLPYIEPELRENRGEIDAAKKGKLPHLITIEDLRGDLQVHTTASDGKNTLEEMARAAQERGYEYIAVTDHSPRLAMTRGLDADALAHRLDEIDKVSDSLRGFQVLKGIEVDILDDGSLDLPDDILSRLDVVLAAVHTALDLDRDTQTERIIRALDNPNVHILAHPTARQIGERNPVQRRPIEVDLERVMQAALERGCFLEINASPTRLDLDDVYAKQAHAMGLKLAISTDAHSIRELALIRFGVGQARRGWITADDVINTRSLSELRALLKR